MKRFLALAAFLLAAPLFAATPDDLEFLEGFAWGDREAALKDLVPDTDDYYYFHCLHRQLTADRRGYEELFQKWLAWNNHNLNGRMQELRRRQFLLDFPERPDATWSFLEEELNLRFDHRPRQDEQEHRAPSRLDPAAYATSVFLDRAFHDDQLYELTDRGLELALSRRLSPSQRRSLLGRLQRPDVPGLVDLILEDLAYRDSRGFGHHRVHSLLTRAQLEELGQRRPELLREEAYVSERMARFPVPDVDLAQNPKEATAYFRELWDFVSRLGPMHTSLKACVLFQLLEHQRKLGTYDEALFLAYLELPRPVPYILPELRRQWDRQQVDWVNFQQGTGLAMVPPIGNEEPLVREYLLELLRDASDPERYARLLERRWLDALFAESKILHGVGTPEQWASMLRPEAYRDLLDRIELFFTPDNPSYARPGSPLELKVAVKHVDQLLVKVFEIQSFNYYTTHKAPVDQAVDLDGMVATHERTLDTKAAPGRRNLHTVSFPEVQARGVYVVELIGGGVSSRALVHVGHLEAMTRPTAAGQAMLVLSDEGKVIENAAVWLDGREFEAGEEGLILLPYSEAPGPRFVVLRDGDFCAPEQIQHLGEVYDFNAGIHLDPQNLQRRRTATLVLRPDLRLNGIPIDPALLRETIVVLGSTDAKGIRTEREFSATFEAHQEWTKTFYVPDNVRRLDVTVRAKLERKIDLEEIDVSDAFALNVNSARATDATRQLFLTPSAEGWRLEARGLNGEPLPDVPVRLDLYHPGFTRDVNLAATTDAGGAVDLGPLTGLSLLRAATPDGLSLQSSLAAGVAVLPGRLHAARGEELSLPYPNHNTQGLTPVSLWRVANGKMQSDHSRQARLADGELRVEGLEPGDYTLTLHETGQTLAVKVIEGELRHGYLMGTSERLQQTASRLPSLAAVKADRKGWTLSLRNVTPNTRVAVRLSRYADPGGDLPEGLGYPSPSQRRFAPPYLQYVSGRNIGDEYRYVLERRYREPFAGSLLERPGLILNPWELRETTAEQERLKEDQAYRSGRQVMSAPMESIDALGTEGAMRRDRERAPVGPGGGEGGVGYDFLPTGSVWMTNLRPDENGVVAVPGEALAEHTSMDILVLDRFGMSHYVERLPHRGLEPRDQRLALGLDPAHSFSQQKSARGLPSGEAAVFPDLATTRYQTIRTVEQVFDLLRSLGNAEHLEDFAPLKRWTSLDADAKREAYGKLASHEMHLFLRERDPDFFRTVVRPYLANKKDKTLVDRWLLETLTPEDLRLDKLQDRNALELALLARRGGSAEAMQASLREAWELLPPDPEARSRLILAALQSADLDESVASKREEARLQAELSSDQVGSNELYARRVSMAKAAGNLAMAAPAPAMMEGMADMAFAEPASPPPESAAEERAAGFDFDLQTEDKELDEAAAALYEAAPQRLYRALPRTKEWAEQNYYKLRVQEDVPGRIPVSRFWRDVAAGVPASAHLLEAHRNLTEIIAALAFCGLPFEAPDPKEELQGAALTLTAEAPCLLVTEQVLPAEPSEDARPLLLSQQFFRPDDPYRYEGNEQIEKYVTGEFIRGIVYGARVTLTNPTASRRRLTVLLQLPLGAIPVRNSLYSDDRVVTLEGYTTQTVEYFFYFPASGTFAQFPAHAAVEERVVGRAEPREFRVVDRPTEVDKTSWAWVSQHASDADVLTYLTEHNARRLDLNEIAWRMKDRSGFEKVTDLLIRRGLFHDTLFSYAVHHRDAGRAVVWLSRSPMAGWVGPVLESPLLTIDPVERKTYEHLEYDPLVNPRAHPVGAVRKILNPAVNAQYRSFLHHALYRSELMPGERLALVYYLLLQDRLEEAKEQLGRIASDDLHERVQWDYLRAWLALRELDPQTALTLAEPHAEHAVPRWRARYQGLVRAVREAQGLDTDGASDPTRQEDLDALAAEQPSLSLTTEAGRILATSHRLQEATLHLYPMDIELLFSRKPFLAGSGADFAVVKPAYTAQVALAQDGQPQPIELPEAYRDRNLMVELRAKGLRASVAWYAHRLRVRTMESYGHIEVRAAGDQSPLPKTYVKVYARGADGRESFWKDGYTDLRGRFDYLSLNDRKPEEAAEFSILVLHPEHGALIRSAAPPTR